MTRSAAGDRVKRGGRVELPLQHRGSAAEVRAEADEHRADVEQRHHQQHPAVAAHAHLNVHRLGGAACLPLAEDAAFRAASRPAGVHEQCDVLRPGGEREQAAVAACGELLEVDSSGATAGATRAADGHQHRCDG